MSDREIELEREIFVVSFQIRESRGGGLEILNS
jgi:hypothetical protein